MFNAVIAMSGTLFCVGEKIRNMHGLHGHVTQVNEDGTYEVDYIDGQSDKNLLSQSLKKMSGNNCCQIYSVNGGLFLLV